MVSHPRLGDRRPAQDARTAGRLLRPCLLRVGLLRRSGRADRDRPARRQAAPPPRWRCRLRHRSRGVRRAAARAQRRALHAAPARGCLWSTVARELGETTSVQVCGTEWVGHASCISKLAAGCSPGRNGGVIPGRLAASSTAWSRAQKRAVTSSEGALLIDEVIEWVDGQLDADPERRHVRARIRRPNASPLRSRSATSCPRR